MFLEKKILEKEKYFNKQKIYKLNKCKYDY